MPSQVDQNTCPKCRSKNLIGIEYSYDSECRYDGISEFLCGDCGYRKGRWTGNELKDDEHEPPFGERHRRKCPDFKE